jgi:hypothetical protein
MAEEQMEVSGPLVDELINSIGEAMANAIEKGMETSQAASLAAIVAADYGRAEYGDDFLDLLTGTIQLRRGVPIELENEPR